jgi:hypothetical protein
MKSGIIRRNLDSLGSAQDKLNHKCGCHGAGGQTHQKCPSLRIERRIGTVPVV